MVSFHSMTSDLRVCTIGGGGGGGGGGARGQNLERLQKVVFLCWSFLEVYIFATIRQQL